MSRQHSIALGGFTFVPDLSGALFLPADRLLLVADLHLEQGQALARRGLHVPPYDTGATLAMLEAVLRTTAAQRLVLLGDSFHDAVAHEAVMPHDAARLRAITAAVDTIWISGNHDPVAHGNMGGACVDELALGDITLRHIPSRLKPGELEIAGHLHPGAALQQRGHMVRAKCFVADQQRIILPAFGSYTGALNVRTAAFRGLLDKDSAQAFMLGRQSLHRFPLSRLS